jgi:predicted lipid-binding transport protein (Tim44 family)
MNGSLQFLDIILYAMIAAFIFLRLRSVLGRRTGHQGSAPNAHKPRNEQHQTGAMADDQTRVDEDAELMELTLQRSLPAAVRKELTNIARAEPSFRLDDFLQGAKQAYKLILEAFWAGRKDDIREFLSDQVYDQFSGVIDDRESEGLKVENRLLDTDEISVDEARLVGRTVEITIKFISDIIAVTRNREGSLVEGDLSDSIQVTDIWTFSRELGSRDPNWLLVATRAG